MNSTGVDWASELIRSFGNEAAAINIFSPLTLIVGYNGSGKTTIIECLKYATTGEMPPNSRGGAFIHDPKLTGERDQWAQVKMQFKATNGARMVITRNLQLTIKKATRQTRAMECNLVMSKDGEKTSISSRVTELDAIMPQYLGVSKAILENVIFCHQDDSLWPMSEPKALKTKFDAIFEAQKYTKAIENIRSLRKKHKDDLEKLRVIEQHAKVDKDKANSAKHKSIGLSREIESLRKEAAVLQAEAESAFANATNAKQTMAQFTEVVERLKFRKQQRDWILDNIKTIESSLEKREESNELLQTEFESHQERLDSLGVFEEECRKRVDALMSDIRQKRIEQSEKGSEKGKYQEQNDKHEQHLRMRDELIRETAKKYELRAYDIEHTQAQVDDFMSRLIQISEEKSRKVEQLRKDYNEKLVKIQGVMDTLNRKSSATQQKIDSLRHQIDENNEKIKFHQSEADSVLVESEDSDAIEADIRSLQAKLETARAEVQKTTFTEQYSHLTNKILQSEEEREKLYHELLQSTRNASEHAELELSRQKARSKKINLEVLTKDHAERIEAAMERPFDPASVKDNLATLLQDRRVKLGEQRDILASHEKNLQQIDYNVRSTKEQLTLSHRELLQDAEQISHATDGARPEEYLEVLSERQENRDVRANDVKSFEVLKKWYGECISIARSDRPACRLCKRSFVDQSTAERFIKTLERSVSETALSRLKTDLSELEQTLTAARNVRGSYDHWQRLKEDDLPKFEKRSEELSSERRHVISLIEKCDVEVKAQECMLHDIEEAAKLASTLVQARAEWELAEEQVSKLVSVRQDAHLTRGSDELEDDMDRVKTEIDNFREAQSKLQAEQQRTRATVTNLELSLGAAQNRQWKATAATQKKASFMQQITNLKDTVRQQKLLLQACTEEHEELEPHLRHEQKRRDELRQEGRDEEQRVQQQADKLKDGLKRLTRANQEIRAFVEEGGAIKLRQCEQEIEVITQQTNSLESQLNDTRAEAERITKELHNQHETKHNIENNMKYRQELQKLTQYESEIEELSKHSVDADHERLTREYQRWTHMSESKSTERSSKLGSIKAKDDQLVGLIQEWETDYHDAAQKYRRAHIEVETTKAAVEDLGRYSSALDQAIMKYHSLKMEEINRIIEELWKRTYQGTDVDTILIRSDNENTRGNRSYNYRVCMIKQDAEMDMRGRCSAGQRVLASIIIRLALAECFGVNCGLIALDEPTTNLDRDNIRSLAESLHDIIDARRGQSNFQLIVITHDEDFLRYMRCSDFCENYFRVQRDDRQKSEIWRNSIADVM